MTDTLYFEVEYSNTRKPETLIEIVDGKDNLLDEIIRLTSDNEFFIIAVTEFTL